MKNPWKWAAIILAVVLIGALIAVPLLGSFGFRGGAMMGGRFIGPHMQDGFRNFDRGLMPFGNYRYFGGGLMMLGMWLIPLALIGLIVLGVVALFRRGNASPSQPVVTAAPLPVKNCVHCGQPVQETWAFCPACGEKTEAA